MASKTFGILACAITWMTAVSAIELQPQSPDGFEAVYRVEYDGLLVARRRERRVRVFVDDELEGPLRANHAGPNSRTR